MTRLIQITDFGEGLASAAQLNRESQDERLQERKKRLNATLTAIVAGGLTDRQHEAIQLYYFEQMTMPQIAARWGVNKSTVSRTIHAAKRRIEKCMRFCLPYM